MNPNYNNNNYNPNYNNYNPNYNNNYNQKQPMNNNMNYNPNNNYQRQGFPNQNQNYQQYPQNQNMNYQMQNAKNMNYQNNQQNPQQNQNRQGVNPYKDKLRYAYELFTMGQKDYKNYSLELALDKFEKAAKIIKEAYPHIQNDPKLKETTDKFQRQVDQLLKTTEYQIQHKYDYKSTAGFADVDYKKRQQDEIAQMIRDAEESNKKTNYYAPQNNNNTNTNNRQNYNNTPNTNNTNNNNNAKKKDDKSIVTNDLRDKILSEIVESKPDVKFDDVVGLKEAKQILKEIIIIPNLRPDLFTGLRSPPRGLLLFGPPGTGKTMIAKAVATECKCTFFSISASSLTSKYLGESEKLVRALFQLAYEMQPSVVFIDEVESILSKRKEGENDAMKRLKTEFLIQFDGVGSSEENRVLIIGATNRPFDLDPAVIRRLPKRVYVGPFDDEEKKGFIKKIITQNKCNISDEQFLQIAKMCNNYSNSDLKELCREAAYEPLRELNSTSLQKVDELRPIVFEDFNKAVRKVRGTLTKDVLRQLEKWNEDFGALGS